MSTPRFSRLPAGDRRAQILDAARRAFGEGYYSAVSTSDIAAAAGVSTALVHHYFGTKRGLFLEVVRETVELPPPPPATEIRGRPPEEVVAEGVDAWLTFVERNRNTWLATLGAEGFGNDPELSEILDRAREDGAMRVIEMIRMAGNGEPPTDELRAVVRAYGAMAEEATREWLLRDRLSRSQVQALLSETLLGLLPPDGPTPSPDRLRRSTRERSGASSP